MTFHFFFLKKKKRHATTVRCLQIKGNTVLSGSTEGIIHWSLDNPKQKGLIENGIETISYLNIFGVFGSPVTKIDFEKNHVISSFENKLLVIYFILFYLFIYLFI